MPAADRRNDPLNPVAPAQQGDTAGAARTGAAAAIAGYLLWGLVPIYWKQLTNIPALELIAHRVVWSVAFLLLLVRFQGGFREILGALRDIKALGMNTISALLLTVNWLIYVWGVNAGQVIECSLGYFLVPLVNVAAGRWVLHEHLRRAQWIAIGCAGVGVGVMIVQLGRVPWIALSLAASWGVYSLMRKQSPLGSLAGLTVETLLMTPLAAGYLLWLHLLGSGALGRVDAPIHALILSAGVITALPLLFFAYGARRLRMTTLGLLQYIAPTVQFAIGILVYQEPFSRARATGFAFIWAALALYTIDNLLAARRAALAV